MEMTNDLSKNLGVAGACDVLGVPRSSWYRHQSGGNEVTTRPSPARTLSEEECQKIRDVLNSERFRNLSPRQVYATLLDEGTYYCHWSTMYRILAEHDEVHERRNQLTHPKYAKPQLLATGPNQLWSWDITKLRADVRLTYYYLYVILDVYSRYVVGWMLADGESEQLAYKLIKETCHKQDISPHQLTLHADRGASMTAKSVEQLLKDLNVAKSHSRPYTPNDNPFSEAQFKTLKYRHSYPQHFLSLELAQQWTEQFFQWYNYEHYHSALNLMTPCSVHYGEHEQVRLQRQAVLQQAYLNHPERFVHGVPHISPLPEQVWINQPITHTEVQQQQQQNLQFTEIYV